MQQLCFFEKTEKAFWKDLTSGKFARMVFKESKGQYLKSSTEVFHVMKPIFAKLDDVEQMYCIFMDNKNNIKSIDKVASGSLTSAAIYPRELIKLALKYKAGSVVISYNHPSGDPQPSREEEPYSETGFCFQSNRCQSPGSYYCRRFVLQLCRQRNNGRNQSEVQPIPIDSLTHQIFQIKQK